MAHQTDSAKRRLIPLLLRNSITPFYGVGAVRSGLGAESVVYPGRLTVILPIVEMTNSDHSDLTDERRICQ